ncbi:MAG: type II toxin-antitoxin system YafQ family toxin [Candidatus Cloacimonadaceae bacterium]|nr:type II toxin-antitoxin system YafQ family toxin [Candidatus Cloacimonadota bacterium]MDX9950346.1 type II toxin-antitoxin system YafQ family toxin [Candidatus Syntrophosphaera sp.]NLN85257.1 type II toxin-antitoxin system YafQ family toxin [Candidatus Cloacimonadota bacterium]
MLQIFRTSRFKRDFKNYQYNEGLKDLLWEIIDSLRNERPLPANYRDHQLKGEFSMCRECHITPDILLIYRIENSSLFLIRMGSHSDLF